MRPILLLASLLVPGAIAPGAAALAANQGSDHFRAASGALSAPDTLVGTFACTAAAPTTACGVTASAVGGTIDQAHSDLDGCGRVVGHDPDRLLDTRK